MKTICTSLFGDPLHSGHIECLNKAKELGDYLLVFVDSDRKAILKKGFVFIPEYERLNIIKNLKCVDEAVVVDTSIAEALDKYKPHVFAKGGDRNLNNLPQEEIDACKKHNIEIVCGLGEKIQASSSLINNIAVEKPWGKYIVLHEGLKFKVKKIIVNPKSRLSLQYHTKRDEYWSVCNGVADIQWGEVSIRLNKNESVFVPKDIEHRITNNNNDNLEIIEVQLGICDESDIVRISDDYNRI